MNVADPIDLAIDPITGDMIVTDDVQFVRGVDAIAQLIRIAVLMFAGEWFADLDEGIPYFLRPGVNAGLVILGQRFREARVLASFRPAIAAVEGVAEIVSLSASFERATRLMSVQWVVRTAFGDTLSDTLSAENVNG